MNENKMSFQVLVQQFCPWLSGYRRTHDVLLGSYSPATWDKLCWRYLLMVFFADFKVSNDASSKQSAYPWEKSTVFAMLKKLLEILPRTLEMWTWGVRLTGWFGYWKVSPSAMRLCRIIIKKGALLELKGFTFKRSSLQPPSKTTVNFTAGEGQPFSEYKGEFMGGWLCFCHFYYFESSPPFPLHPCYSAIMSVCDSAHI